MLPKLLMAVVLAGGFGGVSASSSQAADAIFVEDWVDVVNGAWSPYSNLLQIDVRSLDTHSACLHAYSSTLGWTADYCTNDIRSATYGGVYRAAHVYSGWAGNVVKMRGRYYW